MKARDLAPLLRWAGGKRWIASAVRDVGNLVGATSYVEPFAGGAAVFFASHWPDAVLGDANPALIGCYRGLAADPGLVRRKLSKLPVDQATFDRVGAWKPTSTTGAAARLLYLNRTAYAGMYRENARGEFNVPFAGDRDLELVLRDSRIEQVGAALAEVKLVAADFEETLRHATRGSLIFCDPPYALAGAEDAFRRYSRTPFSWKDQVRLAQRVQLLAKEGSTVVVSNSADSSVRDLYRTAEVVPIARRSSLSGKGSVERKEAVYVIGKTASSSQRIATALVDAMSAS